MLAIRTILHPTDFSEQSGYAFEAAFALAQDYGARLVLLHVAAPPKTGEDAESDEDRQQELQAKLRWLQPEGPPMNVESLVAEGDPAVEILRTAGVCGADLVVMGTHGRTEEHRRALGGVAEQVIGKGPCPVVVVRAPFAAASPSAHEAEQVRPGSNARVIAALNDLVATCKDGENGYRAAETDVGTTELKGLFDSYAKQRAAFASALLTEIHRLDTTAERKGSPLAMIHRGWMNLKAALKHRDARAVIDECERGEHAAGKDYAAALKQPLPQAVKALVEEQYSKVKEAHERINGLKVIGVINDLVATCKDGEKGYLAARGLVDAGELKEMFFSNAKQRARFAAELQAEVRSLGDAGEVDGTFSAGLRRGWMSLKAAVKHGQAQNVIDECTRGEQAALKNYEAALTHPLPPDVKALVEKQYAQIKEVQERIATLHPQTVHA